MRRRRQSWIVAAMLLALLAAGCNDRKERVSLTLPDDWHWLDEKDPDIEQMAQRDEDTEGFAGETIATASEKIPLWVTRGLYVSATKANMKKDRELVNLQFGPEADEVINGTQCHRMQFAWNVQVDGQSVPIRTVIYVFFRGSRAHIVTCTSSDDGFASAAPLFEKIVRTIKFEPPAGG